MLLFRLPFNVPCFYLFPFLSAVIRYTHTHKISCSLCSLLISVLSFFYQKINNYNNTEMWKPMCFGCLSLIFVQWQRGRRLTRGWKHLNCIQLLLLQTTAVLALLLQSMCASSFRFLALITKTRSNSLFFSWRCKMNVEEIKCICFLQILYTQLTRVGGKKENAISWTSIHNWSKLFCCLTPSVQTGELQNTVKDHQKPPDHLRFSNSPTTN